MGAVLQDMAVGGADTNASAAATLFDRQRQLFELSPGFLAILSGPDHRFEFVNRAYVRLAGDRQYVGRTVREVFPDLAGQEFFELMDRVYETGERFVTHAAPVTLRPDGDGPPRLRFVDFIYEPILGADGRPEGIFVEGHDITEAKRAQDELRETQRRQELLIALTDRFRSLDEPADLSYAAAELLGQALGVSRAGYGVVDHAAETITIERDWNAPGIRSLAGVLNFRDYGTYIEELKRGETVVFEDARRDPRTAATVDALEAISALSVVNLPIQEREGFAALLYLNHATPRPWTADELALIREVAERTRMAVERRRAEIDAREAAKRLRLAQRAARAVTWQHDLKTNITHWDDVAAMREILGAAFPEQTPLGDIMALMEPEESAGYLEAWGRHLQTGEGRVTFSMVVAGARRWFEASGRVTEFDAEGKPAWLLGILIDVTDRVLAEKGRTASQERLQLAIDAAKMAVWDFDSATQTLSSSPELNRLLGHAPDEVLDLEALRARYYPGDEQHLISTAEAALAKGERFFEAEYRFYRADGSLRWFLMRAEIKLDAAGAPARTTGVLLDITDRKIAEERLIEREADLLAAVEAGSLATFDFDHEAQRMRPSPGLSELYGFEPGRAMSLDDIRSRYHPDAADQIISQAVADLADPSKRTFHWLLRLQLPDGENRWVEGRGEYVRDIHGKVLRSRGVVLDVTARKRWEEHQKLLVNELNHRVKNTLAIVQGLAQQSFRRGSPERARDAFEARLTALSAAHNLLTRESWESALVGDIVAGSVHAALGDDADRVKCSGPSLRLTPQTAVSVALAVHELCTNARKYGALSNAQGTVDVSWTVYGEDEHRFRFLWREAGGPPVTPPAQRSFGTRMIERGLATELNGSAALDFLPEGLLCTIDAPLPRDPT